MNDDVNTKPNTDAVSFQFSLASLFLLITVAAVTLGIFSISPGLGFLFGLLSLPSLIRTLRVSYFRRRVGKNVSPIQHMSVFLGSFAATFSATMLVLVASFGSMWVICAASGPQRSYLPSESVLALACPIGLFIFLGSSWLVALLVRRVWHQDRTNT